MRALFNLINRYFWRAFWEPFYVIAYPILIIALIGNSTYSQTLVQLKASGFSEAIIAEKMLILGKEIMIGVLISSIISNALVGFPLIILEFKKSTLIKRIGSANLNKTYFMITTLLYQMMWTIFSLFWVPFITFVILAHKPYMNYSIAFNKELLMIIPFLFITFFVCISIGLLVVSVTKSYMATSALANFLYYPFAMISGGFATGAPQYSNSSVLNFVSYFIPIKYASDPMFSIYQLGSYGAYFNSGFQAFLFPIIAIVFAITTLTISIKTFKWGN